MKGIIFTSFCSMVEEKYGLETRINLIKNSHLPHNGSYTSGGTYPDQELNTLVQGLAKMKDLDVQELIENFGIYTFGIFTQKYPIFFKPNTTLKDFLKSVDHIIHVEINKLYAEAKLPSIQYEEPAENKLVMLYRSPRKLCQLGIGLIKGAALHFKQPVKIEQPLCMHRGADHCRLEITFEKSNLS